MRMTTTWLRLELPRRWRSLALLALLIALATATVLTAVAGVRRGHSAVNRLYGPTLPATVTVLPNQPGFDWNKVRALPQVESVSRFAVAFGSTVENAPGAETQFPFLDSSMTRTIERPVVLAGRLYTPDAADEVVVTPGFAGAFHKHPGDLLTLDLASVKQANSGYDGSDGTAPAGPRVRVRIVGVVRSPWITDDPSVPGALLTSPALWAKYPANILGTQHSVYINALIRLRGGGAAIPAFRAGLARVTGRDDIDVWNNSVNFGDPARRVTSYEAACLLAFALAALITALFLVGQAIARYVSNTTADLQILQSVGLTRRQAPPPRPPPRPWPRWPGPPSAWPRPSWPRNGCRSGPPPQSSPTPGSARTGWCWAPAGSWSRCWWWARRPPWPPGRSPADGPIRPPAGPWPRPPPPVRACPWPWSSAPSSRWSPGGAGRPSWSARP